MDGSTDNFFEYYGSYEVKLAGNGFSTEITVEQLYQIFAERLKAELATPKVKLTKSNIEGITK